MEKRPKVFKLSGRQALIITLMALPAGSTYAQFWNGSGTQTFTTSGNVGIGIGPVFDARLRLLNNSDPSSLRPGSSSLDLIPGVVIQRDFYTNGFNPITPSANIMEVWHQQYTGPGGVVAFTPGPNQLKFVINADGKVGVGKVPAKSLDVAEDANIDNTLTVGAIAGASSPDVLTVSGNITFTRPSDNQVRNIRARTSAGSLMFFANTAGENGPSISLNGITNTGSATPGGVSFNSVGTGTAPAFDFYNYDPSGSGSWNARMRITADGKVIIGSTTLPTPAGYNLYVDNGILTKRLKVALPTDPLSWSDFVFNDDYELRSLDEVESYIAKHKHLPEIPSAAEVHRDGIDVAQMDAKLLQKIEELTLYLLAQQKEINLLKKKLKKH